ncbi:Sodium/proline symporter [Candidatus Syntrophocurvum alkaliphilum]|uniref:Sodium/proline symporter n=1 Tax=Candidatus Syntrophocurvum alkaliphilum TaxID=2293317 RepID=A0A6I6D9V2_9FIRM|nr:sodium/solute symporter [Candidatus Syntrophocurvum alkaliphilum]QGT99555.1 Sodium/proline symporter [Candidatus Syntrophocurvum alkaliphilum]
MFLKVVMISFYIALIVGLSLYTRSKTKTIDDFVVGNRSVGPWISAFSFGTAYFSAVLLIGFAGSVGWNYGVSALWIALGNSILGTYLAWKILAPRTREMTSRLNVLTMPSFLEARYGSRNMRIFASLVIFVFFVPYSASVFMGLSYLFEQIFSIPYVMALVLMTLLTALYLTIGGYIAVTLIDFIQGLIMIVGVALMVYFVVGFEAVGGFATGLQSLGAIDPQLAAPVGPPGIIGLLSLLILTSLGTWGLPQMVQKFYGIKSEAVIPKATVVSTIFALIITGGAYFVGSVGRLFFDSVPLLNGVPNTDLLVPNILSTTLPELVAVLILILVLSASMSTLSSLVLASSSSVSIDLLKGSLFKDMSEKSTMIIMRLLCVVFVMLSLWIALNPPALILTLMALSWGTVAGTFLAAYIYGLFWEKTTKAGAWAGMLSGLAISVGGYLIISNQPAFINGEVLTLLTQWGTPFFGSLAMLIPLAIVPLVSYFTPDYTEEHLDEVYNRKNGEIAYENVSGF